MTSLYLFDNNQELIKIIPQKDLIQARQKEELQEIDLPIDRFTAEYKLDVFKDVEAIHYYAVKDLNKPNQFHMYFLKQPIINENTVLLEGTQLGYKELKHFIIQEIQPQNRQADFMLNQALQGTGWRVGYVAETVQASQHFYFMPVLEALRVISGLFGLELVFKVEISGQKITDKWIEAYNRRGSRTMKRFTHGSNLLSIKGTIERDNVYTALIGRGRGEETQSGGFGRRITFTDIEWSVANGDPVNKPLGQNYVEIPHATEEYGINMPDGSKVPAMGVVEFQDIEDPQGLLKATYDELVHRIRPMVQYETTVADVGAVELGEVVGVHRYDLDLHYETRVFKLNRDYLNPKRTPVELGDKVIESRRDREVRTQNTIGNINREQLLIREEVSHVVATADGMNTITYSNIEPDRKRTGDYWVRDHPQHENHTQWLVWGGSAWVIQIDTYLTDQNTQAIEAHQQEIQDAKSSADEANQQINDAVINAGFTSLTDTISYVDNLANTAEANAQTAISRAIDAHSLATDSISRSQEALSNSNNAVGLAQGASSLATTLSGQVSDFELTVNGFNQTVNNYTNQVAQFTSDVNGLNSTVANYETQVDAFGNTVSTYATQVSQFENTVNGLNSTVSSFRSDVQGYQAQVSTLTNTVDGFNATVQRVEADYSNLSGTVQSLGASIGVVEGQITNRVWQTDIRSAVDGIEIGGRNYFSGYNGEENSVSNNTSIERYVYPSNNNSKRDIELEPNTTYTMSAWFRTDVQTSRSLDMFFVHAPVSGTIQHKHRTTTSLTTEYRKHTFTFTTGDNPSQIGHARFDLNGNSETNTVTMFMKLAKLEKGNKATDWTPAPEDTLQLISHVETEWRQTAQGFEQSITRIESDVDGKASSVAFNTLTSTVNGTITRVGNAEGRLTTVETNVSGLQTTVASRASQTQVTQLADGFNVLSTNFNNLEIGGRNLYPNTSKEWASATFGGWQRYFHNISIGENETLNVGDQITWSGVINPESQAGGIMAHFTTTTGGFTQRMSNFISGGTTGKVSGTTIVPVGVTMLSLALRHQSVSTPSQVFNYKELKIEKGNKATDWTPAPEDMATQAQFTVLNNNINMRVSKGELMSQINIEAGRTLIQSNRLYLDAQTTVFGGNAFIPGAFIENASIDSAKIGTLDGNVANIINLNASNIATGTISGANSSWNLNTGIHRTNAPSNSNIRTELADGRLFLSSNAAGDVRTVELDGQGLTYTTHNRIGRLRFNGDNFVLDNNLGLFGNHINSVNWLRLIGNSDYEMAIHKHPTATGGAIVDSSMVTLGLGIRNSFSSIAQFYGQIDFRRNLHMLGNDVRDVNRVALSNSNTHLLSHPSTSTAGGALVDSTRLTLGIGSPTSFNDRITVTNSQIDLRAHTNLQGFRLDNVARIALTETNGWYMHLSTGTAIVDTRMVTIATGNVSTVDRIANFLGTIHFFKNLNMNGNSISNQSDERLKKDINNTTIDSLGAIRSWNLVDFNWIDSELNNRVGRQLGVIAQDTPELAVYDAESDVWSINSSKQIMMNTHAIQQLDKEHENTLKVASHAYLLAEQHEDELECLRKEVKELKEEIEKMRGMCA